MRIVRFFDEKNRRKKWPKHPNLKALGLDFSLIFELILDLMMNIDLIIIHIFRLFMILSDTKLFCRFFYPSLLNCVFVLDLWHNLKVRKYGYNNVFSERSNGSLKSPWPKSFITMIIIENQSLECGWRQDIFLPSHFFWIFGLVGFMHNISRTSISNSGIVVCFMIYILYSLILWHIVNV